MYGRGGAQISGMAASTRTAPSTDNSCSSEACTPYVHVRTAQSLHISLRYISVHWSCAFYRCLIRCFRFICFSLLPSIQWEIKTPRRCDYATRRHLSSSRVEDESAITGALKNFKLIDILIYTEYRLQRVCTSYIWGDPPYGSGWAQVRPSTFKESGLPDGPWEKKAASALTMHGYGVVYIWTRPSLPACLLHRQLHAGRTRRARRQVLVLGRSGTRGQPGRHIITPYQILCMVPVDCRSRDDTKSRTGSGAFPPTKGTEKATKPISSIL